jgi:hypothetical protein
LRRGEKRLHRGEVLLAVSRGQAVEVAPHVLD